MHRVIQTLNTRKTVRIHTEWALQLLEIYDRVLCAVISMNRTVIAAFEFNSLCGFLIHCFDCVNWSNWLLISVSFAISMVSIPFYYACRILSRNKFSCRSRWAEIFVAKMSKCLDLSGFTNDPKLPKDCENKRNFWFNCEVCVDFSSDSAATQLFNLKQIVLAHHFPPISMATNRSATKKNCVKINQVFCLYFERSSTYYVRPPLGPIRSGCIQSEPFHWQTQTHAFALFSCVSLTI